MSPRDEHLTGREAALRLLDETGRRIRERARTFGQACPYCSGRSFEPLLTGWPRMRAGEWPDVILLCQDCTSNLVWRANGDVELGTAGIYFLRCQAFVKIGHASDLAQRLIAYESAIPLPFKAIGFLPRPEANRREAEAVQLQRWAHLTHQGEWFHAKRELLQWVFAHTLRPQQFIASSPRCSPGQRARLALRHERST